MSHLKVSHGARILLCAALLGTLAGCGGTKILDEEIPLALAEPLASGQDASLAVTLDWVIVRDGPGAWARNADWDEYLVRVENVSPRALTLTAVVVYDSTQTRLGTHGTRADLVAASRDTEKRYAGQGVEVKAGLGGGALMAAGATSGAVAVGAGAAALYMSSAAAVGVVGALVAAPALVAGGIVKSVNQGRVSDEIEHRHAVLPLTLGPGETRGLNLFFPLAPSPGRLEVTYNIDQQTGPSTMALDIGPPLAGLHLGAE